MDALDDRILLVWLLATLTVASAVGLAIGVPISCLSASARGSVRGRSSRRRSSGRCIPGYATARSGSSAVAMLSTWNRACSNGSGRSFRSRTSVEWTSVAVHSNGSSVASDSSSTPPAHRQARSLFPGCRPTGRRRSRIGSRSVRSTVSRLEPIRSRPSSASEASHARTRRTSDPRLPVDREPISGSTGKTRTRGPRIDGTTRCS